MEERGRKSIVTAVDKNLQNPDFIASEGLGKNKKTGEAIDCIAVGNEAIK